MPHTLQRLAAKSCCAAQQWHVCLLQSFCLFGAAKTRATTGLNELQLQQEELRPPWLHASNSCPVCCWKAEDGRETHLAQIQIQLRALGWLHGLAGLCTVLRLAAGLSAVCAVCGSLPSRRVLLPADSQTQAQTSAVMCQSIRHQSPNSQLLTLCSGFIGSSSTSLPNAAACHCV